MDNISHSVVSLVAGELLHRTLTVEDTPERQSLRQKLFLFAAVVAGNFPDLDIFLSPLLRSPLGYLLHHRGHSHTFLYELPQALAVFAVIWFFWPHAHTLLRTSGAARRGTIAITLIAFWLHIGMDYLNSYGVHPFYPFDAHWIYGDMVFIVEPLFWVAFGVPVAILTERLWLRFLILFVIAGLPLFATFKGFLPAVACGALVIIGCLQAFLQSRASARGRSALALAFAYSFAFILVQGFASAKARAEVEAVILNNDRDAKVLDVAMSASPFDPVCWAYVSIEENFTSGTYRLRTGSVSLAPEIIATASCPTPLGRPPSLKHLSTTVVQYSEITKDVAALKKLNAENCFLNAWLRWARIPLLNESSATDLRFSRSTRGNFSSLYLKEFEGAQCPTNVPAWIPPREDLLTK